MYDTQLIKNKKSFFTYHGESLDLMNPPDISNQKLLTLYFKFINNTLAIYKASKCDGRIPVFWTKIADTTKLTRSPDYNSTLRTLNNEESYYIILSDNAELPLEIPTPLTFNQDYCTPLECIPKQTQCCSNLSIVSDNFRDITLTDQYNTLLSIPISGLSPNERYFYEIKPIISNWPAKIHPISGFIERSGPTNEQFETTANIELTFSYVSLYDDYNISSNLTNNDTSKVFTLLDIELWQDNCKNTMLIKDNISIVCNNCLGYLQSDANDSVSITSYTNDIICPKINFSNSQIVAATNKITIPLIYQDIDISKNLSYVITSKDANWPIKISSNSGSFVYKDIYPVSGNIYGSGLLKLDLEFSNASDEPTPEWSNLDYTLDNNYSLKLIKENIYANLEVKIVGDNYCTSDVSQTIVFCDDCLQATDLSCIEHANVIINDTTNTYFDLKTQRPGAEYTIPIECCDNDRHISVTINNICPDREYEFIFESEPELNITPSSGTFFPSSSQYELSAVTNLNSLTVANLRCNIKDLTTQQSISDSSLIRCNYCEWNTVKILDEMYTINNYNQYGYYYDNIATNADGSLVFIGVPSGYLYRSTDYGINWEPLDQYGKQIWSSIKYAKDSEELYITTGRWNAINSRIQGTRGNVYKSVDNGDTRSDISPLSYIPSLASIYTSIDVSNDAQNIGMIFNCTGVIVSFDHGDSWSFLNPTGSVAFVSNNDPNYQDGYWKNISITNNGAKLALSSDISRTYTTSLNIVGRFYNSVSFMLSTNSGINWQRKVVPMLASETTQSINALYSKDGSTLVAYPNIDTQEIYLSYDDGDSWYPKVFSLSNVIINSVNVSNDGSDISISVSNNAVIFNSKDYGANWTSQYVPSYSQNAVLDMNTTHNSYKFALNKFNNQFSINVNHCPTEN